MGQFKIFDRDTIQIFWQESIRSKRVFGLALLHPLGVISMTILLPLFVGKTLAALALPDADPAVYLPYLVGAALLGVICNRVGFNNMMRLMAASMYRLQAKGFDSLLRRSLGFHSNNVGGKLVSDATDFASAYQQLAGAFFLEFLPFSIVLVAGSLVVFTESWLLGLVVTAMAAMVMVWAVFNSRQRTERRQRRLKATKAVTSHLADSILNVQTVKTFAREGSELKTHDKLGRKLLNLRLSDWLLVGSQGNNRIIALVIMQLVFVVVTVNLVRSDPALLGIGIFAFSFTITLSNRLFQVDTMLRSIEEGLLQASPMTEIILQQPEIQDGPHAKDLRVEQGAIAINQVHFHYKDEKSRQTVFSELNLDIKPGEKIGLVGPSGGGKSTLTRLLLRFEKLDEGEISIDNQNIAEVKQDSLRRSIAYVPQEPLLFHRSIRENIAYSKPDSALKAIKRAARLAHADSFIEELPDKYKTIVGERGVKLSGGQRQRIAIARAILKDAPILVLDEATSALDSESEVLIQDALWKLMKERTAIVIAHRLSTIQRMDRIIVMDHGQIIEEGSHRQLLGQKGVYAKLWAHQSGGFLEQ